MVAPLFLGYLLNHAIVSKQKSKFGQGDAVVHISSNNLGKIIIPLPPLPEQRAIAAALSDVDGLLSALDALIAKKRALKTAAMQSLLTGRVRLPGFTGEWVTRRLGDVLKLQYGQSQKGIATVDGKYPILATSGVVGRTNDHLYNKPSIIIGRKGTINAPIYVDTPFWAIDTTFYSIVFDGNSVKFLFYLLSIIDWQSYNEASGVPSLNANTVQNIKIFLPPTLDEQRAIAAVLADMDAEIAALEARREKVRQVKQGMMQVLLTGKVRLVTPAIQNNVFPSSSSRSSNA
jgi:type I restriction enzyme S subunit